MNRRKPKPAKQTRTAQPSAPKHQPKTPSPDSRQSEGAPAAVRPNVANVAKIAGLFGGTGSGKSTAIRRTLAELPNNRTVLIFDAGHEYAGHFAELTASEPDFLESCKPGARLILRPSFDAELRARQFNRFCAAALAVVRSSGECVVVAEELQRVVTPGHAPEYWAELIQTGRKFGATVIAASQRPAEIDKTFFSNATTIRTGRLNYQDDRVTLARVLDVPVDQVAALSGTQYIERDLLAGTPAVAGEITFS